MSLSARDYAREYGFVDQDEFWLLDEEEISTLGQGLVTTANIAGQSVDVNTLLTAASMDPATVAAQATQSAQQIGSQLGQSALDQWNQATSNAANEQRKTAALSAGIDLATHGFNPDSTDDQAKIVSLVAGAVAFVPVAGPFLSGAVVLLYAIGEALAKVLEDLGIIGPFGCFHKGADWGPKDTLGQYTLPAMPSGSFASIVIPALGQNATDFLNCKYPVQPLQVVAAIASMFNQTGTGDPVSVFVPQLDASGAGLLFTHPEQLVGAFQPTTATSVTGASQQFGFPDPTFASTGIISSANFTQSTDAFILQLAHSTLGPASAPDTSAATPPSTPAPAPSGGGGGAAPSASAPAPSPTSSGSSAAPAIVLTTVAAGTGTWLALGQPLSVAAAKVGWHRLLDRVVRFVGR